MHRHICRIKDAERLVLFAVKMPATCSLYMILMHKYASIREYMKKIRARAVTEYYSLGISEVQLVPEGGVRYHISQSIL
jgi:hypothetical protein